MEFYKTNKTNPFGGCLPMILQLIFLIAIYQVLLNISRSGLVVDGAGLYSFISNPGQIGRSFLGIIDLSQALDIKHLTFGKIPQLMLIAAAAISQYFQTKMLMPLPKADSKKSGQPDFSQVMSRQMLYLGPLLTLFIGISFPAGLALYWLTSTVFSIVQQYYIVKKDKIIS